MSTTIEVSADPKDKLAGGDTEEGLYWFSFRRTQWYQILYLVSIPETKTNDPRLKRLDRFKPTIATTREEEPPLVLNPQKLTRNVNELLNKRKPYEAYLALKAVVSALEIHKYVDLMMVMAKDWFASQVDSAYDPRAVFIELKNLNHFSNLWIRLKFKSVFDESKEETRELVCVLLSVLIQTQASDERLRVNRTSSSELH